MRKANYFTEKELELFNAHKPLFDESQMKIINRKTPASEVEVKADRNGFKYKTVKAAYMKALVTLVTGGNFDFEVLRKDFISSTKETVSDARLTIRSNGQSSFREQTGQHHLNVKTLTEGNRTTSHASDIGNGFKASNSDAFKKCASEFGFCWDIYRQEHSDKKKTEQPEPDHAEKKKLERLEHFLDNSTTADDIQYNYNTFLQSANETKASEAILDKHMKRVLEATE